MLNSPPPRWIFWLIFVWVIGLFAPVVQYYIDGARNETFLMWVPVSLLLTAGMASWKWWRAPVKSDPQELPLARLTLALVLSLLLLSLSYLYGSALLSLGPLVLSVGLLFVIGGQSRSVKGWFGLWALFLLVCRLPGQLELKLLRTSTAYSSEISSSVLDSLGVLNAVQAEVLAIKSDSFDLDVICESHFTYYLVVALAAYFSYFRARPLVHTLGMLAGGYAVAILVNAMRVVLVVIAQRQLQLDILVGGWAIALFVLSLVLSLGLLWSFDSLLQFLLAPSADPKREEGKKLTRCSNWLAAMRLSSWLPVLLRGARWDRKFRVASLVVLAVSLLGMTVFVGLVERSKSKMGAELQMNKLDELVVIDPADVQFTRPGWKLLDVEREQRPFDSIWGAYSFIWRLKYHDTMVIMAMDYPFNHWHDVKVCYGKLGWTIDQEQVVELEGEDDWKVSETDMMTPTGDFGYILCSQVDQAGGYGTPKPADTGWDYLKFKLGPAHWVEPFRRTKTKDANTFYQSQAMVSTDFLLDEPTKQEIRLAYDEFRKQTRQLILQRK